MKIEPIRAAMNAPQRKELPLLAQSAIALPTKTGAIAAGSVRRRAAMTQILKPPTAPLRSRAARELAEVRAPLLLERLAPLRGLVALVEEEVGVVGKLLQPRVAILVG